MKHELATAVADLDAALKAAYSSQLDNDVRDQRALFTKWRDEQQREFEAQVRHFSVELKKHEMLEQLAELERQEAVLTYFDKREQITDLYYGRGFPDEHPSQIPVEPEESEFKQRSERHFKLWPKYANKPASYYTRSREEVYVAESLKKTYLTDNKSASSN